MPRSKKAVIAAPVGRWGERESGILAVAATLFAELGYDNVSMAAVARAAGLSEGTLYNYFRDKRDLVIRVSFIGLERRVDEAERAIQEAPNLRAGLERLIAIHLATIVQDREVYRIWLREVRAAESYGESPARALLRRYTNLFGRLLRQWNVRERPGDGLDPIVMRDLVYGGAEHVAWSAIVQNREKALRIDQTAAQITDAFMRAFRLT